MQPPSLRGGNSDRKGDGSLGWLVRLAIVRRQTSETNIPGPCWTVSQFERHNSIYVPAISAEEDPEEYMANTERTGMAINNNDERLPGISSPSWEYSILCILNLKLSLISLADAANSREKST